MSVHRARPRTALAAVLVCAVLVGASTTAHAVPVARAAADRGVAPVATETLARVVEDGRPGAAGTATSTAAADGTGPDAASGTDPGAGMDPGAGTDSGSGAGTDSGSGAGAGAVGAGPVVPAVPDAPVPDGAEPPAAGSAAPEEGASPSVPAPDPAAPEEGETPPGPDPTVPDGEPAPRVVVLPPVLVRAAAGDAVYLVPVVEGVRWSLGGEPMACTVVLADGYRTVEAPRDGGVLRATAAAEDGHVLQLPDGRSAAEAVTELLPVVTAVLPAAQDGPGRADTYTVPDAEGLVVRDATGAVLPPGSTHAVEGYLDHVARVVLTLSPAAGLRLAAEGEAEPVLAGSDGSRAVELVFSGLTEVRAPAPVVVAARPGAAAAVEVPHADGLEFVLDERVLAPGRHPARGTVTVTARALDGYVLVGETSWELVLDGPAAPEVPAVPPASPAPAAPAPAATPDASGPTTADGPALDLAPVVGTDPSGAVVVAAGGAPVAAPPAPPRGDAGFDLLTLVLGGALVSGAWVLRARRDQTA
ncbi:hypothetical protein [Cellulosimicrobium cellulans]|uniref:hypothetical protein n=1 Tax=Cellulosimicrobium cellulans TaxID=1710 RepID=UPI001BA710F1|nr:hypothetical protein [Cellulosimicrobium cellulans]QUB98451.1 hypothetical protein J5A69_11665 [Cellulosimicrobium cellulans]